MKKLRLRDRLATTGVIILVAAVLVGMSAAFPEYPEAAAEIEQETGNDARIEPETAKSGIITDKFAENPQNRTIYGKYRTPSGFPDELSAMPCCNIKVQETEIEQETEEETEFRIYRIAGELPDPELQRKIYDALTEENISYWYEGALAQCFQESHFQKFAVNQRNGKDSGLFQYRSTFWDWSQGDIFDEDLQIRKYAAEMAARFNAGLTADEAISRHKTSDYCTEIDWNYVKQVRQWLDQMEIVQ